MLNIYKFLMIKLEPALMKLLSWRMEKGKESPARLDERKGKYSKNRPLGPLAWVHAASVGEAQSALILIDRLLKTNENLNILVTTGTITSATLMEKNLPKQAFHQFYPLDHPDWVKSFLDYWKPDLVLWMESEIWPNMLSTIQERKIPATLINARLSKKSLFLWQLIKPVTEKLLRTFSVILTQTEEDARNLQSLGARQAIVTDNLKFSAAPLLTTDEDLKILSAHIRNRPTWLFSSTHAGEEDMACRVHHILKNALPDLLTIIVPRHPERRDEIEDLCRRHRLSTVMRGENKKPPDLETEIYVADTLGELGLFYRIAPIACIGRSFSDDGGGGHNPIEAAQLNCAILHGPNVQNLRQIYFEMSQAQAALKINDRTELANMLREFLNDETLLNEYQKNAVEFAKSKGEVIETVMKNLEPLLEKFKTQQSA